MEEWRKGAHHRPVCHQPATQRCQGTCRLTTKVRNPATCPALPYHFAPTNQTPTPPPQLPPSPGASGGLQGRRGSLGGVELRPWEVRFGDLVFLKPVGEGSYGRVSMLFLVHVGWSRGEVAATTCSGVPARVWRQPWPTALCSASPPGFPSFTASRPSMHPLTAQVYLAEWAATQVAVKVLIGGQLASSGEVQRALAMSAPIQQKLEQEASLLASLRCAGGGGGLWAGRRVGSWLA